MIGPEGGGQPAQPLARRRLRDRRVAGVEAGDAQTPPGVAEGDRVDGDAAGGRRERRGDLGGGVGRPAEPLQGVAVAEPRQEDLRLVARGQAFDARSAER